MQARYARRDQGQAVLAMVAVVAVVGLLGVGVAEVGVVLVDQARARTAADAAALAGTSGGPVAAASMAAGNGATLVSFVHDGDDVVVVVRVGRALVNARSSNGP